MTAPFDIIQEGKFSPPAEKSTQHAAFFGRTLPRVFTNLEESAPYFEVDKGLAAAANVALCLGQPLLLTGEPGTGKTQFAYYLAWRFGAKGYKPYVLPVKSTTTSRDLLYSFDTVAYFRTKAEDVTDKEKQFFTRGPLWEAFEDINQGLPAVVLIDEIDKAPRDFPNDLLFELDQYSFSIPELKKTVSRTDPNKPPPMVVITSNSERRLPEPFLRRVIFHHIEFDLAIVRKAVEGRRKAFTHINDDTIDRVLVHLENIRKNNRIKKLPATAELLSWLRALDAAKTPNDKIATTVQPGNLPFLTTLLKDTDDLAALK